MGFRFEFSEIYIFNLGIVHVIRFSEIQTEIFESFVSKQNINKKNTRVWMTLFIINKWIEVMCFKTGSQNLWIQDYLSFLLLLEYVFLGVKIQYSVCFFLTSGELTFFCVCAAQLRNIFLFPTCSLFFFLSLFHLKKKKNLICWLHLAKHFSAGHERKKGSSWYSNWDEETFSWVILYSFFKWWLFASRFLSFFCSFWTEHFLNVHCHLSTLYESLSNQFSNICFII